MTIKDKKEQYAYNISMYFIYDGIRVCYTYKGKGEKVILFLHGWGGDKDSFSVLAEKLDESVKILSVDFPPFGQSEEPRNVWGVKDYGQMIITLLNKLHIEKVDIISHSFGGRVAIFLASDYTERVKSLILIDSAGIKPKFSFNKYFRIKFYKLKKKLKLNTSKSGSKDYQILSETMKKTFVKIVNEDLQLKAKMIPIPTLLVWGENDNETPLYMAKKLNKLIKNSGLVIIKSAGHFPHYDRLINTSLVINSFLKGDNNE